MTNTLQIKYLLLKIKKLKLFQNEFDSENEYISITPLGNTGQKHVWRWSDREKILNAVINEEIQYVSGKLKLKIELDLAQNLQQLGMTKSLMLLLMVQI